MALFDSLRRWFGGKTKPNKAAAPVAPQAAPPAAPAPTPAPTDFWSSLGTVSRDAEGFLTIRRETTVLHGLGDPAGVLVVETDAGDHAWPRLLLAETARQLGDTDMRGIFEHYGMTVIELRGASAHGAPGEPFLGADDTLGALVGKPLPDFGEDADGMRVIPVVLLTAAELAEVRAGDLETAGVIVERLGSHQSRLDRASVV